jgi:hypothetical protein
VRGRPLGAILGASLVQDLKQESSVGTARVADMWLLSGKSPCRGAIYSAGADAVEISSSLATTRERHLQPGLAPR